MAKLISLHSVFVASQQREFDSFEANYSELDTSEVDTVHNSFTQQVSSTIKLLLFVDTGLYPTYDPTRTLGVMEQERWIDLPIELASQSTKEQIKSIKTIITTHYAKHHRGLPLWGDIQRYCLYKVLENGELIRVWFDVDGVVLSI